ncbi:MAG: hypothetical protein F9K24_18105 [Leptonema illini]|uniref:Uncharacterized protein n=1 Tax=Leptonema illini TaxID=183 RepID=A0A833GY85_9LEPT|nr:MAG: hypothetical protein F9K24_18105 [Leptonema illini]
MPKYINKILSILGGISAGLHFGILVEAYIAFPLHYTGSIVFFTMMIANTIWLSYSAFSLAAKSSIVVVTAVSIVAFPSFFLLSQSAYLIFDLFHFKRELFQYSLSVYLLLALPILLYACSVSKLRKGSTVEIMIFGILLVFNGLFYSAETIGSQSESEKLSILEMDVFDAKSKVPQRIYSCPRTIVSLKIDKDQLTGLSDRKIYKALIQLDESEPIRISYDPAVGTGNLIDNPTRVNKIAIQLVNVNDKSKLPTITIQEKCPFFPYKTYGCLDLNCSACIEAQGF